jgi:4-hydroxybenzoate polyprenyltransferase
VEAGGSIGIAGNYLRLVRPKQWTKNGFVLAGVVFAHEALVVSSVVKALLAFAAFCALSGAVYAANDVLDVEEDRKHPRKRRRPVASGEISPRSGFSKRRYELASLGEGATVHRKNLADYSVPLLDEMMNIMISGTIIAYVLYTFFEYENYYMMASIPFVVYGVFRYMLLVHRDGGGNPDTLLLADRPLQVARSSSGWWWPE